MPNEYNDGYNKDEQDDSIYRNENYEFFPITDQKEIQERGMFKLVIVKDYVIPITWDHSEKMFEKYVVRQHEFDNEPKQLYGLFAYVGMILKKTTGKNEFTHREIHEKIFKLDSEVLMRDNLNKGYYTYFIKSNGELVYEITPLGQKKKDEEQKEATNMLSGVFENLVKLSKGEITEKQAKEDMNKKLKDFEDRKDKP